MTLPRVLLLVLACQIFLPPIGMLILIGASRLLEFLFWAS